MLSNFFFFRKSCRFCYNVKCGGAREATHDSTIWRMRVACWISKTAHAYTPTTPGTHTGKYVILIAFPWQQWFANAPQCYVIRTLRVFMQTAHRNAVLFNCEVPVLWSREQRRTSRRYQLVLCWHGRYLDNLLSAFLNILRVSTNLYIATWCWPFIKCCLSVPVEHQLEIQLEKLWNCISTYGCHG